MRRNTTHLHPTSHFLLESLESRALLSSAPLFVATSPSGGNNVPSIINPSGHPALVATGGSTTPIGASSVGSIVTFTRLAAAVENGFTVALVAVVQSSNANSLPSGTVTFRTANGAFLATLRLSNLKTTISNPALGEVSIGLPLSLLPNGTQTVIASYSGDALHAVSISNAVTLSAVARRIIAIGAAPNSSGGVSIIDTTTGITLRTLNPFPGFTGGIHVAVGDINGDGIPDVVVAPAAGGVPLVRVYDLSTGLEIRNFFAFNSAFHGGVNLALGDVNDDGTLDIITAAGPGGGPHVEVFSGLNGLKIASFFAFNSHFTGGVSIASADVTGDGRADIIAAPMSHGGPEVAVFDGQTDVLVQTFFGFDPSFTGGLSIGVVDLNHDGIGEIVTAPRQGPLSQVRVFPDSGNAPLGTFIVDSSIFGGGLNISTFDFNGDGVADIIVGSANGLFRPQVFSGVTRQEIGFLFPSGVFASSTSFIAGFSV